MCCSASTCDRLKSEVSSPSTWHGRMSKAAASGNSTSINASATSSQCASQASLHTWSAIEGSSPNVLCNPRFGRLLGSVTGGLSCVSFCGPCFVTLSHSSCVLLCASESAGQPLFWSLVASSFCLNIRNVSSLLATKFCFSTGLFTDFLALFFSCLLTGFRTCVTTSGAPFVLDASSISNPTVLQLLLSSRSLIISFILPFLAMEYGVSPALFLCVALLPTFSSSRTQPTDPPSHAKCSRFLPWASCKSIQSETFNFPFSSSLAACLSNRSKAASSPLEAAQDMAVNPLAFCRATLAPR
mmetsp:Transcript_1070/g.6828  ORF Transcript_1070/g.6828 Transcript_1070/m.6828 type:complete len:299 (+) Transcript_1070:774-1670(+)